MHKNKVLSILITGLALFAMFFGAGNLILPVMIGIEGGRSAAIVVAGFVLTGVLLPVLAMVAAATSENGLEGIASRIGRYPGVVFAWMAILTTGVLYAVPRVATVSFNMSAGAIGNLSDKPGSIGLFIYTLIFLLVTAFFVVNPSNLMDKIGGWLTPALLILMVLMIVSALLRLKPVHDEPADKYLSGPFVSGLLTGYNTLDAIASLVFGLIIITALRERGFRSGTELFRATALSGLIAGTILVLIYIGLASIGVRIGDVDVPDGATGLAYAAKLLFGTPGQWILGIIAILACLTTSVGLIGASVQFFTRQLPRVPRTVLLVAHTLIALAIANLGLVNLMNVVVPLMYLCYPVTIAVVVVSLIDIFVPGHLYYTYRCVFWPAALFGLIDAIAQGFLLFQATVPDAFKTLQNTIPLAKLSLGWVLPVLVLLVVGLAIDAVCGNFRVKTAV